jgi:hypothetical protein
MIPVKTLKANFQKFGFKKYDTEINEVINKSLQKHISRFVKNNKKSLKGGRITMPSEYYAIDSKNYHTNPDYNGTVMDITTARPGLDINDPMRMIGDSRSMTGGSGVNKFKISLSSIDTKDVKLSKFAKSIIKDDFSKYMTTLLNKLDTKNDTLKTYQLRKVMRQK